MNKEEKTPYLVENKERDTFTFYVKGTKPYIELQEQITQLTNNWNELEEWLEYEERHTMQQNNYHSVLEKMKEIKDDNNE